MFKKTLAALMVAAPLVSAYQQVDIDFSFKANSPVTFEVSIDNIIFPEVDVDSSTLEWRGTFIESGDKHIDIQAYQQDSRKHIGSASCEILDMNSDSGLVCISDSKALKVTAKQDAFGWIVNSTVTD